MANDTVKRFKLVLYHVLPVHEYLFMALGAGYLGMLAVKFEGGSVVIILHLLPFLNPVTTPAIGSAIFLKLPAVYIFMAGDTLGANWCKNYVGLCSGIRLVTRTTGYPVMRTFQLEGCCAVVETSGRPAFGDVALVTVLFGVVLCLKGILVDIFVTVHTALSDISELPFRLFRLIQVTGEAGCGYVRACERENRFFVFRDTKKRIVKPVYIVTFRTVSVFVGLCESRFMVILVTGIAIAEFQRLDEVGNVTILAINRSVHAQ